jgi:Na+-transporting NADH:ubiquinone oxidoreductase subunit NqrC
MFPGVMCGNCLGSINVNNSRQQVMYVASFVVLIVQLCVITSCLVSPNNVVIKQIQYNVHSHLKEIHLIINTWLALCYKGVFSD